MTSPNICLRYICANCEYLHSFGAFVFDGVYLIFINSLKVNGLFSWSDD